MAPRSKTTAVSSAATTCKRSISTVDASSSGPKTRGKKAKQAKQDSEDEEMEEPEELPAPKSKKKQTKKPRCVFFSVTK